MTHKDLDIWKMGVNLVTKIYQLTQGFPKVENYGLASQMQRAAVPIQVISQRVLLVIP